MEMYAIFDRKLGEYGPIATAQNDAMVLRGLTQEIRKGDSPLVEFPTDFDVMHVGSFDVTTGVVTAVLPRLVSGVADLVKGGVNGGS